MKIDHKKTSDFENFIKTNAKSKEYWIENKNAISVPINKSDIDVLFTDKGEKDGRINQQTCGH